MHVFYGFLTKLQEMKEKDVDPVIKAFLKLEKKKQSKN